ncbi:hypothetical protein M9Y10_008638 [Tritrichomonas musculus]|uniref:Uncharacterized protein n=1 Tax=Tritrichomonas musculus TaxID=1915356 RepID=A0ABR2IYQ6_9EUKA
MEKKKKCVRLLFNCKHPAKLNPAALSLPPGTGTKATGDWTRPMRGYFHARFQGSPALQPLHLWRDNRFTPARFRTRNASTASNVSCVFNTGD